MGARFPSSWAKRKATYFYDANGNLQKTTGMQARNQTWTDFNQPSTLTYLGGRVDLIYDADYKHVKDVNFRRNQATYIPA